MDDYRIDLQSLDGEPIGDDDMQRHQNRLIDEVAVLQVQQIEFLNALIDHHGVERVHIEGFCIGQGQTFERVVGEWTKTERKIAQFHADIAAFGDNERAKPMAEMLRGIEDGLRLEKAHFGAAAQLWHRGRLKAVLPCEDETLLDAAKPITDAGEYREDSEAIEAREDFIVQTLLDSGPVSIVILGGSHDLAENVERLSDGTAEYLRVELEAWRDFASPGSEE